MARWVAPERPLPVDRWLWVVAVLFFGVADAATTTVGLAADGVVEVSPTVGPHLEVHGVAALLALKLALFAGGYLAWRALPRPYATGVPLGLASLGLVVAVWNASVLVVAAVA